MTVLHAMPCDARHAVSSAHPSYILSVTDVGLCGSPLVIAGMQVHLSESLGLPGSYALMVVDDVGIVRRATARMLAEEGYRVYEAASAVEAVEVLTTVKRPINLVLCDVVMPDVSGIDLANIIQAEWPQTRVLFMSAYAAEVLVREGLQNPGVHFLAKPYTRDDLLTKVREALVDRRKESRSVAAERRRKP